MTEPAPWRRIAGLEEFKEVRKQVRDLDGASILLYRLEKEIFAVSNVCTHLWQPLNGGRIIAGQIHCPFHGACFDLRTGKTISGPAVAPLRCYDVELRETDVFIRLRGV